MPFVFAVIGSVFLVAGVRGSSDDLLQLLKTDLFGGGKNSFIYWILAIAALGAIGYVDDLRPLSRALLVLVLVVLVLSSGDPGRTGGGLFAKFTDAISSITKAAA
jgi:hypothetical protein